MVREARRSFPFVTHRDTIWGFFGWAEARVEKTPSSINCNLAFKTTVWCGKMWEINMWQQQKVMMDDISNEQHDFCGQTLFRKLFVERKLHCVLKLVGKCMNVGVFVQKRHSSSQVAIWHFYGQFTDFVLCCQKCRFCILCCTLSNIIQLLKQ